MFLFPLPSNSFASQTIYTDLRELPTAPGALDRFPAPAYHHAMKRPSLISGLFLLPALAAAPATFYFVDVGHGNSAVVISPAGETMMLDAGPPQAADRILAFLSQNGITKIDYMVVSHFEGDHMSAVPKIAARVPIANFVDHGENITYHKSDDWWRERRGPWMRGNGWGRHSDELYDDYVRVRSQGRYLPVKPGDRIPVKGLDVTVVSAAGKVLSSPLVKGAPAPASCAAVDRRADDDAEDGQSVGLVLRLGRFRFVYLGDLTWNPANALFCPVNQVGPVDAYLVTHHGQSMTNRLTPYYYGLSCCPPPELEGLHPRAAILSMGAQGHKEADAGTLERLLHTPNLDLWQTELITGGGEKGANSDEKFIANIGESGEQVPYIKMVANPDGSFTITNSRNQFTKTYSRKKP
jgi:competence protein ComEC